MSSPKNIVEINGRKYDASTGKPLDGRPHSELEYPSKENRRVIDGIVLKVPDRSNYIKRMHTKRASKPAEAPKIQRKPEKSKILMRTAVKKPSPSTSHHTNHRAKKSTKPAERHAAEIARPEALIRSQTRVHRAASIVKSPLVNRFGGHRSTVPTGVKIKSEKLEVRQRQPHAVHAKSETKAVKKSDIHASWPVAEQFERAMQEANSHLETFIGDTKKSSKKKKRLIGGSLALVILLVLGFGAYSIKPVAQVKLAGSKAGFSPSLPNYSPAGYGMADDVQANYGEITLSYKSRTDDKGFKIVQEPSQWSSESLVNNFLKSGGKDYDTLKGGGQSIYTYDKTNATWVDGGIWFKLEGNASLTNDQLINIAKGL